jgi:hypothetical protein
LVSARRSSAHHYKLSWSRLASIFETRDAYKLIAYNQRASQISKLTEKNEKEFKIFLNSYLEAIFLNP